LTYLRYTNSIIIIIIGHFNESFDIDSW